MPSRTYVGIDFINYTEQFTTNAGTDIANASGSNQMAKSISASGSDSASTGGATVSASNDYNFTYLMVGDLDFDAFPAIPDNALITEVEVALDSEIVLSAEATWTPGTTGSAAVQGASSTTVYRDWTGTFEPIPEVGALVSESDTGGVIATITGSDANHYTVVKTFDHSASPISKAALEASYTNWAVSLYGAGFATGTAGGVGGACTSEESISVVGAGIRIIVTYESGSEMHITTDPTDGSNVKPGERIIVTDDDHELDLSEFSYAMIINDRVVPLEPQETDNEWEIYLEVPWPPDDECAACWDACAICDSCGDPCDADLEGQDCTDCIAACLECITLCFESMGLAEECLDEGGEPGPAVLILGTQFSGSVRLGTFTILEAEASGIYRFVTGKTNDTIYTPARDGTTYDVRIPNPGGKTGLFRS